MKYYLSAFLMLSSCATASLTRMEYTPSNAPAGGVVSYLNQGADMIINRRREDAVRKMQAFCGGAYHLESEESQSRTGAYVGQTVGATTNVTAINESYRYLRFTCK